MLLKYKVRNFGSFKDEAVFSMKPGKVMNRFEDNVVCVNPKLKVLKTAVVVGENAGGKTCFMRSLDYLKHIVLYEDTPRMLKGLSFNYNMDESQCFEITVLAENDMIYTYALEIDKYSIVEESLLMRKYNQDEKHNKIVFSQRRGFLVEDSNNTNDIEVELQIHVNENFVSEEIGKYIVKKLQNNDYLGLLLKKFKALDVEVVLPFIQWVDTKLIPELPTDLSLNAYKQMEKDEKDLSIMKTGGFFEIFSLVDSSIIEIEINEEDPYDKTIIIREDDHGNKFKIELKYESSGTKEFFAWSIQLWKVINKNAVLFADEIDRVLNTVLAEKITAFIQGSEHKGQFIFSTHNVMHLNTHSYMKEQLNFITKRKENLSSELYSLADFKDYRYEKADVYDLYLKGILGGVPND